MNLRTKQDFNLHSDTNINFHARGSLNFTAEQNVNLNAEAYVNTMGEKGILNSSQKGSVRNFGRDGITSFTPGPQLHGADGRISLAGTRIDLNSNIASSTWGPGWLKPDHSNVGIKVTGGPGGLIDIDSETPLQGGKPNKVENKTTVSDFVTHEPYTRTSSTALKKTYINEAMAEIKLNNPDFSAQELQDIKTQLLKKSSISAVSNQLEKIVKLNDKVKLPLAKLTDLKNKAENLESTIKNMATGFIQGKITEYKTAAISAVRSFFRF